MDANKWEEATAAPQFSGVNVGRFYTDQASADWLLSLP